MLLNYDVYQSHFKMLSVQYHHKTNTITLLDQESVTKESLIFLQTPSFWHFKMDNKNNNTILGR